MTKVYARAGIPVYWIVNLVDRQVEVYTQPSNDGYQSREDFGMGPGCAGRRRGARGRANPGVRYRPVRSEPGARDEASLHPGPASGRPCPSSRFG